MNSTPKQRVTAGPTSRWGRIGALGHTSRGFLLCFFVAFNAFAWLRAAPVNTDLRENRQHLFGDSDRRVHRVFELASQLAAKPFFEVKNHAIYRDRNPGLFKFVAELFVRAGVQSPWPIQAFAIVLWNIGLVFCYLWLLHLFDSEFAAASGLVFLLTTPFLLYHSSSIHEDPYTFSFGQVSFYAFTRYLKERSVEGPSGGKVGWLVCTCVAYGIVCLNYWMHYLSTYFVLLALAWRYGRLSPKLVGLLALPALLAVLLTVLQIVWTRGWSDGIFRLVEIAVARISDARLEGATLHPKRFLGPDTLKNYPLLVTQRVSDIMGYHLLTFFGMLLGVVILAGREAWTRYRFLLLALLGAFSWSLVMIQHTVLHKFTGMYGYATWTLIVAAFAYEVEQSLRSERARQALGALSLVVVPLALGQLYWPKLIEYGRNVAREYAPKQKGKPKKKAALTSLGPERAPSCSWAPTRPRCPSDG